MRIYFPGWYFPGFALRKGQLLDVWLLAVHVVIPPWDVTFWGGFWVWYSFLLFDTAWITDPVGAWISDLWNSVNRWISNAWSGITGFINDVWAKIYGEIHNAWSGIVDFIDKTWAKIYGEIHNAWSGIIEFQDQIWGNIYREIHRLWDTVVADIDRAKGDIIAQIAAIPQIAISAIVDIINRALIGVVEMLIRSLDEMARDYYERHSHE